MYKGGKNAFIYKLVITILIAIFAIFAASCDKIEVEPEVNIVVQEEEKPARGGTLLLGAVEPKTLNPILNHGKSYMDISKLLFLCLAEYDETLKLNPVLAEKWEFVEGTSQLVVTLKQNAKWSDGKSITANDVRFTLDTIKNSKDSIFKKNIQHLYSYRVVNDKTIRLVFNQSFAGAADALNFPVVPEHIYAKGGKGIPVSSGPYKIQTYNKLDFMELTRNENWFMAQQPYINKVRVLFVNDIDAFSSAFQSKELDILNTSSYDWEKYNEMRGVKANKYVTLNFDFMALNFNNPLFQDRNIRKAIILAINRRAIIDKYLLGNAVLTDVPIHPQSWLNDDKSIQHVYSRNDAKSLLFEIGFEDSNGDGILERDFEGKKQSLRFNLLVNNENDFRRKAAEEIKKNLQDVGIAVDIKLLPFNDMKLALDAKQYDTALTGIALSADQDLSFLLHSTQIRGGKNFLSYSNPELDALLLQAYTGTNDGERKELYNRIQGIIREDLPFISMFFKEGAVVAGERLKGQVKPTFGNPYNSMFDWYISKSKQ